MKRFAVLLASTALLAAGAAHADCEEELSMLEGLSKSGSTAPLAPGTATPQTGASDMGAQGHALEHGDPDGVTKNGTQEPLGVSPDVATSAQDAQAQQEGGLTAAQQAGGADATQSDTRAGAIARAHEALAAGDEEACMKAVEEAKSM
ncbi:hypothetical protein [Amaricoccus solimangrovi]|uniref:Uncharacterized protein n=1 Tax=Amaricoccus solimangrovi TaxID=2589815 RepID=A0A501WR61_9RHOB|nr:hypothetical protein [Amaricoccus solimangrovi]TPE49757.1 hypothetical protein FJM51_14030 [Amaricoccus solimangrovi]